MVYDSEVDLGENWCLRRWLQALIREESHAWTNITPHLSLPMSADPYTATIFSEPPFVCLTWEFLEQIVVGMRPCISISGIPGHLYHLPGLLSCIEGVSSRYLISGWHLLTNRFDTEKVLDLTKPRVLMSQPCLSLPGHLNHFTALCFLASNKFIFQLQ